ncbi:MAG: Crp/Fnr family transcriptional regulator [Actinomycetota bacterium]|nr:Crp/Fnr family transcriptional regulator [Actinomycetota bacterium]
MDPHQTASLLSRTRLFGGLDQDVLHSLGERTIERSYKRGQLIFSQGDMGESLYVLVDGVVKVFVTSDRGDEMVLTTLHPPEVFGELALIDGGARSASAEALEPAAALVLTRPTLLELLAQHPSLTDSLLRSLGSVLRRLTEQTSDLVFLDLHGRVAKLLLNLASEQANEEGEVVVLDLHMTQSDLAGMVGGSRQSVNQILRHFQGRGYIELDGRRVKLLRPDLLRRRAGL